MAAADFSDVGSEWTRLRAVGGVMRRLGLPETGRLTKAQLATLVKELRSRGLEAMTEAGDTVGMDGPSPGANGRIRLRKIVEQAPPPVDARQPILSAVRISNFKSFQSAELPLADLTVLVGRNGAGKTNALEALKLLCWAAQGRRMSDLLGAVDRGELGFRGKPSDLFWDPNEPLGLGCTLDTDKPSALRLELDLAPDLDALRVVREVLNAPPRKSSVPLYRVTEPAPPHGREMQVEYDNFLRGGKKPRIACVDEQPVFTQLTTPARFNANHAKAREVIPEACRKMQDTLSGVLFLDPAPGQMRGYSLRTESKLRSNGANVSGVLHYLTETKGLKAEILEFVRALPESDIEDIGYLQTPRNEVMVTLKESFGGVLRPREAVLLSDGTLRVLAIAAAMYAVPPGSIVVVEEIDNGIHPSRVQDLLGRLQTLAGKRRLRLLITTHNPALLDVLPTSALARVVACFRDPGTGSSHLVRLSDLDDYPLLTARGPLGRVAARGELESFLKDERDPGGRREETTAWLDELFGGEEP